MRIHVVGSFYIEADGKNYTLREEYAGQTRCGEPRKGQRTHGYFRELSGAVWKCLELNTLNGAKAVELWECAKIVEESNKNAVNALEKEIEMLLKEEMNGLGR